MDGREGGRVRTDLIWLGAAKRHLVSRVKRRRQPMLTADFSGVGGDEGDRDRGLSDV